MARILHIDLGELDSYQVVVKLLTNGHDMSEELLGVTLALAISTLYIRDGRHTVMGKMSLRLTHLRVPVHLFLTPSICLRPSVYLY